MSKQVVVKDGSDPYEDPGFVKGLKEWELSRISDSDLITELWRRGKDIEFIAGAFYALGAMADANNGIDREKPF